MVRSHPTVSRAIGVTSIVRFDIALGLTNGSWA